MFQRILVPGSSSSRTSDSRELWFQGVLVPGTKLWFHGSRELWFQGSSGSRDQALVPGNSGSWGAMVPGSSGSKDQAMVPGSSGSRELCFQGALVPGSSSSRGALIPGRSGSRCLRNVMYCINLCVRQIRNEKRTAILVTLMTRKKRERLYGVYRPNTGLQPRYEILEELKKKYRKVSYSTFCPVMTIIVTFRAS